MEDWKFGVSRIKKLKTKHRNTKSKLGKTKYDIFRAPELFVRKVVESSDDDEEENDLE